MSCCCWILTYHVWLQKRNLSLQPEEQRLLDRLLRDGKRNGMVFKLGFATGLVDGTFRPASIHGAAR